MSDIDLFKHHLDNGVERVPFSFMARGTLKGREIAFRVSAFLFVPVLDNSVPLASGLFETEGELFEKDFRSYGDRVFEPFEAASPRFPQREAFGVEKLARVLSWQAEPRAGASAHPLARLGFADERDETTHLGRVLAPHWSWHGRGPVWRSTAFYQSMSPPPRQLVRNGNFIGDLSPIPDPILRMVINSDADELLAAAQASIEAQTAIINGRLWVQTSTPLIQVRAPSKKRAEVILSFTHDDHNQDSRSDESNFCFALHRLDEADACAKALSGDDGADYYRRGRLDIIGAVSTPLVLRYDHPTLADAIAGALSSTQVGKSAMEDQLSNGSLANGKRAFGRERAIVDSEVPDDIRAALGIDTALELYEAICKLRTDRGTRSLAEGDLPTNRSAFRRLLSSARAEISARAGR